MFKPLRRYRHASCLDIDLDVASLLGEDETHISLLVKYWNRHLRDYQGGHEVVRVRKDSLDQWEEIPLG
jgi:hypothetical protein